MLSVVGLFLFIVIVMILPHKENVEQTQHWKISILYGVGSFFLWLLITAAMSFFDIFTADTSLSGASLVISSIRGAILPGSCIGIYFAIFIVVMVYWKFRSAPWTSLDLQTGESFFDSIVNRLNKIVEWFRRAG
jgi:hypothetical protein